MTSRRVGVLSLALTLTAFGCNAKLGHWDGDDPVITPKLNPAQGGAPAVSDPAFGAPMPPPGAAPLNGLPDPSLAPPPWTAPLPPGAVCSQAVPVPACKLPNGASLPSEAFTADKNVLNNFAAGAVLPPGRYRVEYIDGCVSWGLDRSSLDGIASAKSVLISLGAMATDLQALDNAANLARFWMVSWAVGSSDVNIGTGAVWITRDGADFMLAPGALYPTTFTTYGDCVQANCIAANRFADFDFEGGVLGIRYSITGVYGSVDSFLHFSDAADGGRNPTYRLTRLDACK